MSDPPTNPQTFPRWLRHAPWALMILTLAIHAPFIAESGWVIDDSVNLMTHANHGDVAGEWNTATYQHAGGERGHIWRPIPATFQHLAAIALGREGWVFRGLNLGIHLLNIGLLFIWMRSRSVQPSAAGLLVSIWAAHPILVEAVAWSSDIYDLMACTAALTLLWGMERIRTPWKRATWVAGGVMVACLCKESSVALVGLVWVLLWLTPPRECSRKNQLGMGVSALIGALVYLQWHGQITADSYTQAITQTPIHHQIQAWLAACSWLVVPPARAWMAHLFNPTEWLEPLTGALTLLVLAVGIWALHRRRSPLGNHLSSATLAWMGLLVPAGVGMVLIGIQPLRYGYLPLAVFIGLVGGVSPILARYRNLCLGLGLIHVLAGTTMTLLRLPDWQNDRSIWTAEQRIEPDNPWAMSRLGRAMLGDGEDEKGLQLWRDAVGQAPEGIQLFVLQEERLLLAQSSLALHEQGRIPAVPASALAMQMGCEIIHAHEESDQPLPAEPAEILEMMEDSALIVNAPVISAAQLLSYCSPR